MTWACCGTGPWEPCPAGSAPPSTLGSHLRCYAWGNVLQLEKTGRELLARLSRGSGTASRSSTAPPIRLSYMRSIQPGGRVRRRGPGSVICGKGGGGQVIQRVIIRYAVSSA